jgi:predicted PurR-regulated permease PerM
MTEFYQKYKFFFILFFIALGAYLLWFFSEIVIFIIVAMVLSIIGTPMVDLLDRIRIWRFRFPRGLSVTLTLILMLCVIFALFSFFIPLVLKEAGMISQIDTGQFVQHFKPQMDWLQTNLRYYGVIKNGATIESSVKGMILNLLDLNLFSNILSSVISFTGTFFFNLFSVAFLTFFFLYDKAMMPNLILRVIPANYQESTKHVMSRSKNLLSRYFIGMIIQILANILTYSIALLIVGVEGALVIAFFAGIIIIIPYLGGIIAIILGTILGITAVISSGSYDLILPMTIKIFVAMLVVQMIDNNIFQPFIQGKSVKAHPVEIFLVVIAAAKLGGIPGMVVAVPAYGFLKIVTSEFMKNFRSVNTTKQ